MDSKSCQHAKRPKALDIILETRHMPTSPRAQVRTSISVYSAITSIILEIFMTSGALNEECNVLG